jgi:homopolymeric O-antigen transport system permease protein
VGAFFANPHCGGKECSGIRQHAFAVEKIVIEAGRTERHYWRDLWRYRELFFFLAWRDIIVRYKQTAVGVAWALIRPCLTMIVFTIIFGRFAKMPSGGVPYPILVFCGMLPWQLFSNAFSESGNSLVANADLISKIYFPRLIVPSGAVGVGFVEFLISGVFLAGLMVWYRVIPSWRILTLPFFILIAMAASFGAGFLIAALTVRYRDVRVIVPFIVQFGLYVSPVGFSSAVVPDQWRLLYSINPMVSVIDGFRWTLLDQAPLYLPGFCLSLLVVVALLFLGIWYFRKTEKTFADVI